MLSPALQRPFKTHVGTSLHSRGTEGDPWVDDDHAIPPCHVPDEGEALLIVELGEPLSDHLLPGNLPVHVCNDEVAHRSVVVQLTQIQHSVMSFGEPPVLGEWMLGAENLSSIGPRTANPLERHTEVAEGGHERHFYQFEVGKVLSL